MSVRVKMKNPKTGELKEIKVGFNWVYFFWSCLLGIPLFLRKLNVWGSIMLALTIFNLLLQTSNNQAALISLFWVQILAFGLLVFLGVRGNEMTAKNYLELGWEFSNPDSDEVKHAKGKWGIE